MSLLDYILMDNKPKNNKPFLQTGLQPFANGVQNNIAQPLSTDVANKNIPKFKEFIPTQNLSDDAIGVQKGPYPKIRDPKLEDIGPLVDMASWAVNPIGMGMYNGLKNTVFSGNGNSTLLAIALGGIALPKLLRGIVGRYATNTKAPYGYDLTDYRGQSLPSLLKTGKDAVLKDKNVYSESLLSNNITDVEALRSIAFRKMFRLKPNANPLWNEMEKQANKHMTFQGLNKRTGSETYSFNVNTNPYQGVLRQIQGGRLWNPNVSIKLKLQNLEKIEDGLAKGIYTKAQADDFTNYHSKILEDAIKEINNIKKEQLFHYGRNSVMGGYNVKKIDDNYFRYKDIWDFDWNKGEGKEFLTYLKEIARGKAAPLSKYNASVLGARKLVSSVAEPITFEGKVPYNFFHLINESFPLYIK